MVLPLFIECVCVCIYMYGKVWVLLLEVKGINSSASFEMNQNIFAYPFSQMATKLLINREYVYRQIF